MPPSFASSLHRLNYQAERAALTAIGHDAVGDALRQLTRLRARLRLQILTDGPKAALGSIWSFDASRLYH